MFNSWYATGELSATVWSEAFEKPKEYRVQATVGLYSLHMVFPSVIQIVPQRA